MKAIREYIDKSEQRIDCSIKRISSGLLREFIHEEKNVVFSPQSVLMLLGMAAAGAEGETWDRVMAIIKGKMDSTGRGKAMTHDLYKDILNYYGKVEDSEEKYKEEYKGRYNDDALEVSNAIYVKDDNGRMIKNDYLQALVLAFNGDAFDAVDPSDKVNRWISDKSGGRISSIAKKNHDTALISTANFVDDWENPFYRKNIEKGVFHSFDGSEKETNMLCVYDFGYIRRKTMEGFVTSYRGLRYDFMAILPKKEGKKDLEDLAKRVDYYKIMSHIRCRDIFVKIPEFSNTFKYDIKDELNRMGEEKAFTDKADFTGMFRKAVKLDAVIPVAYIDAKHSDEVTPEKVIIEDNGIEVLNEYGGSECFSMPSRIVVFDRPFIYAIYDNIRMQPVFVGTVLRV